MGEHELPRVEEQKYFGWESTEYLGWESTEYLGRRVKVPWMGEHGVRIDCKTMTSKHGDRPSCSGAYFTRKLVL